jgi:hypothetical protein
MTRMERAVWPDMFALLDAMRNCLHAFPWGNGFAELFEIEIREGDIQQERVTACSAIGRPGYAVLA